MTNFERACLDWMLIFFGILALIGLYGNIINA